MNEQQYIVVKGGRLLCRAGINTRHTLPDIALLGINAGTVDQWSYAINSSVFRSTHLLSLPDEAEINDGPIQRHSEWHWADLRELLPTFDDGEFELNARAVQLFHWLREHQYCGICGEPTQMSKTESALECPSCQRHWFPRIQPCIITLIHDKDRILLARNRRYVTEMYSCIAGFAESGESLEQTLHREVAEEVGVRVHNLEYFSSQAWPFPYQLMVGFFAQYLEGSIRIDDDEIVAAKWWSIEDLPHYPPNTSIAGRLIEHYAANPKL